MHLDLIGLLHGPVHAYASLCMTLPNLEENSSVQITLPIAINMDPMSSFERIPTRFAWEGARRFNVDDVLDTV